MREWLPPSTCHMSHVTCHAMSPLFCGEAYWWRVHYQWGLPRLVFFYSQNLYLFPILDILEKRSFSKASVIAPHKSKKFAHVAGSNYYCVKEDTLYSVVWKIKDF